MNKVLTIKRMGLIIAILMILSAAFGFGGGVIANHLSSQALAATVTENTSLDNMVAISENQISANLTGVDSSSDNFSISDLAAITAPSVVEITTEVLVTGSRMQQFIAEGAGSGVILTSDGLIVTNNHVIEDAKTITVRLSSGESFSAVIIGTDEQTDLAVIKIEASSLTTAVFGDSDSLKVGDLAVAIGNPLGELGGTVTDGIISALDREIIIDGESMTLLQTNAAINPGNSGGGLFNAQGKLIGIVNAKSSGDDIEGLGFAIPINTAKPVIEELINYGYVRGRIDLGMTLFEISTQSEASWYRVSETGVYVLNVENNSNAFKAGFESGDCIKAIDNKEVTSMAELEKLLDSCTVGQCVEFTIRRGRQTMQLTLTLSESQPPSA